MSNRKRKTTHSPVNIICSFCSEQGQAPWVFTAKCSHSFHLACMAQRGIRDGSYLCHICGAKLDNLPSLEPYHVKPVVTPTVQVPQKQATVPRRYSDDEPLPAVTASEGQPSNAADLQNVSIKAVPEHDAVAASEFAANFSVLVRLRAPPLSDGAARAPLDLVMVLDVSGSMHYMSKMDLLKRAVGFVIDNLGPSDRLSVVCFSTSAWRVFPLRRMTEQGRASAKEAVNGLRARGDTNIVKGLKKGIRVLEERLHRNPVASIMFLSDGNDTCNNGTQSEKVFTVGQAPQYLCLLPACIRPNNKDGRTDNKQTIPVHAFGFGMDHDPLAMHAIANSSSGTFSFTESYEMVQDAFAKCIGGLLSVVVRETSLTVRSASHGVGIISIPSGNYASEISDQGSRGKVTVGDMYADEEKEFLINISVPVYTTSVGEDEENERRMSLLDITCSFKDVSSKERVEMEFAEIQRPGVPSPSDVKVKLEVDRQRNRLDAAEGIAEAHRKAETGDLKSARDILSNTRALILASESGQAGDGLIIKIEADMKETEEKMGCQQTYEQAGRAYALSNLSAHANQRATTRGSGNSSKTDAYATPNMVNMVNKSQQLIKIEDIKKEEY